jgi:hypothetical protein
MSFPTLLNNSVFVYGRAESTEKWPITEKAQQTHTNNKGNEQEVICDSTM